GYLLRRRHRGASGRAAVMAIGAGDPAAAGAAYREAVCALLGRHYRHTAATSRLVAVPAVAAAAVRAAARDQVVFDDLVEVGLGQGLVTRRIMRGTAAGLLGRDAQ
ncbi:MAG: hypothetical protein M3353_04645, partial [Actinomycetota bacterium]|nr:hypothetical protein [Actinomycetota bacterium]